MAIKQPDSRETEMQQPRAPQADSNARGQVPPGMRGRTDDVMGGAWTQTQAGSMPPREDLRRPGRYYDTASRRLSQGRPVDRAQGSQDDRRHQMDERHHLEHAERGDTSWARDRDAMRQPERADYLEGGPERAGMDHSEAGRWDLYRRTKGNWEREPLRAEEVMTRNVKSVRRETPLREAAQLMRDESVGIVPVVDDRMCLVGVLTDRDLAVRGITHERPVETLCVQDLMSDDIEVVTRDEDLKSVIELMGKKQVRRIPVVDQGDRLIGIIAMADIATRADYDKDLQAALERISSRRSFWSRLFS